MVSAPGPGHLVAGRYRLLEQRGRGAMGIVWQGRDELLDREVAVKQIVLAPMASAADARASYQRTLREARTAARLSHPGVVTVFDVVEEDGMPWIVMELIRARPLDQVIAEDGPLPPAQAAQLGLSLLDALSTAHAAGVLHRDVKPSNVLISPEGKAVLTDFGIATVQGDPGMTQAGMVVGTPGFSPPERVRGSEATPASDLWSLGATLYAAVEGRGPFDRAGGSVAIVASVATEPAPRAPSAGPLASVIEMLLRADPAERPDAATTSRLLTTAWADARRAGYLGTGSRTFAQPGSSPGAEAAAMLCDLPGPPDLAGLEATTATQVVTVAGAGVADASRGAAAAGLLAVAGQPTAPGPLPAPEGSGAAAAAATSVVPDLMATPVFAELKMPAPASSFGDLPTADQLGAAGSAAGDTGQAGGTSDEDAGAMAGSAGATGGSGGSGAAAGSPSSQRKGIAGLVHSRRGLVLTAPVAASAIVAGIVFLTSPGFGDLFGQGRAHLPSASRISSHAAGLSATPHGSSQPGAGSAQPGPGGQGPARSHPGSGKATQPRPSQSGKPGPTSPSSQPSPSGEPTPSVSPSPTPTPTSSSPTSAGGKLPSGFSWQSVSAQSIGTTAGFRLAAPSAWVMTPGSHTVIKPGLGGMKLTVDMAPFAVQAPVREARHLQASAIAHNRYRRYHLVSILARTFRGWPAATWKFWWKPVAGARIDVTELIFTAQTSAGPQPYILSMSARDPHAAAASGVYDVAKRTFRPLP